MIFLTILGFAALTLFDVPQLISKKYTREMVVYFVLMALALTVAILHILDVDMPNPVKDTQFFVEWLFSKIHLTYE
ncbi:MAG: hypothetical protein LKK00_10235 [Intestinimonas sp.]|jgi:hypothetical protein|nr:hypothetical protein [Intestinimonas sp.]